MNENIYPVLAICIIALVTFGLRALPFIIFSGRPLPKTMKYLGKVLPPAIMTVLVVYCLRNTSVTAPGYGIPELISCALVVLLQISRNNMYLSIIAGTLCYMLIQMCSTGSI